MHIRSKFDGGKQINRSQRGSWQSRCAGAGLRINEGPNWGPPCWQSITGLSPSKSFKEVAAKRTDKLIKDRKRKSTKEEKVRRKKCKRVDNSLQSRLDYSRHDDGPNALDVSPDIPTSDLHDLMMSYYSAHVKVTESTSTRITVDTVGQGDDTSSMLWHEERRKRLTASNVGKIAKRRATTKVGPSVKQLLNRKFQGNVATNWGTFREEDSNKEYLRKKREQSPNISTSKSGLVVSLRDPWLGASPQRLVYDPALDSPDGLVEYKNPYSARNVTIDEAVKKVKNFCLCYSSDQKLQLKENHDYYYQIQCAMYCTNRKWCDFVVMTKNIYIQRVTFSEEFWSAVLSKLKTFYFTAVLPQLASPRATPREPSEWLQQEWQDKYQTL